MNSFKGKGTAENADSPEAIWDREIEGVGPKGGGYSPAYS